MLKRSLVTLALVAAAAPAFAELPGSVLVQLHRDYYRSDAETRYLEGNVDLDGDGRDEVVVYVMGPAACGSGGCPTLVFRQAAAGYVLVSRIGLTHPPIRAATTASQGWRNLIVSVGGGGAQSRIVELSFDGKGYPPNPTAPGMRAAPIVDGGDLVIADGIAFDQARRLPDVAPASMGGANPVVASASPSFDCTKAALAAEKQVCADVELALLDSHLDEVFDQALQGWTAGEQKKQRDTQREWLASRNHCEDDRDCLETAYRQRLVVLYIQSGVVQSPTPASFRCNGSDSLSVAYYPRTDPPAAVLTLGKRQAVAFVSPSGSGTRYVAPGVELREHQGEATLRWGAQEWSCVVVR